MKSRMAYIRTPWPRPKTLSVDVSNRHPIYVYPLYQSVPPHLPQSEQMRGRSHATELLETTSSLKPCVFVVMHKDGSLVWLRKMSNIKLVALSTKNNPNVALIQKKDSPSQLTTNSMIVRARLKKKNTYMLFTVKSFHSFIAIGYN